MMEPLQYYIYRHVDPYTVETVYVGKGCYGRAWDVTRNRNSNPEHLNWCKNLCNEGVTPDQYVVIDRQSLSEKEALRLEKEWLHTNGCPVFNRQSGEKNYQAKLSDEQAREVFLLTKSGVTHRELAERFKVSRSCISMISSRRQWRAATACLV